MARIQISRRVVLLSALLIAVTAVTYWPLLRSDFIRYDDREYITANPHVARGLTWENVGWAFRTPYAHNWHPLTWLSHMLDARLFGLRPGWHHFTSLVLHAANALLVLGLFNLLTGAVWRSALVAALFALHPLHVESVAWVAERKDVLSTFFFLLTLLAYAKYAQAKAGRPPAPLAAAGATDRPALYYYAAALVLFTLALLSKPMVVTLPFVLLLLDYWPLGRSAESAGNQREFAPIPWPRLVLEKLPFFCLAAGACLVTFLVQEESHAVAGYVPFSERVANVFVSYVKYLALTLWPARLAIFYPHPAMNFLSSQQWPVWQVAAAALFLAAISLWAWLGRKRRPWLLMGWLWFLGTLVPAIGLVQVGRQAMADRYTYIPLLGVFVCAVWGAAQLARARIRDQPVLAAAAVLLVALCAAAARNQTAVWRNTQTVFEHALAVTVSNAVAHVVLGEELLEQGMADRALAQFDEALRINPSLADAHYDRGTVFGAAGNAELAIEEYQIALALRPWYGQARKHLAAQFWKAGRQEEALAQCGQAAQLDPDDPETRINLGGMLWQIGRKDEALAQYEQALRLDPHHPVAHYNLGLGRSAAGRLPDAEKEFAEAVRLKPGYPEALAALARTLTLEGRLAEAPAPLRQLVLLQPTNADFQVNLGNALLVAGRSNEAATCFAAALRLQPGLPLRLVQAGSLLVTKGQREAATARFITALRLRPDQAEAHAYLGLLLAQQGQLDAAADHYREALKSEPDWPEANEGLAWIFATHPQADRRNGAEAVRLAERAWALDHGKTPRFCATLDAAYAEAGRFPDAVATAEKTRALALAAGQTNLVAAAEARLALYRQGQPYHQ